MAAFIDNCGFIPTAGGTTDWTYFSTVGGYQSPAQANAANGMVYVVRAQSSDLTQWEYASGPYNAATNTFARTTVLYNSAGTGTRQGGAGSKVAFSVTPSLVAVVALAADLVSIEIANGFSAAQQSQARSNINAAALTRTRTVLTSGSGTYTIPAGCKCLSVRMVGGGGGGGGGTGGTGGATGQPGIATTFSGGAVSLSAGGGPGGVINATGTNGQSSVSGGDINIPGSQGGMAWASGGSALAYAPGNIGASSAFGGAGYGGWPSGSGGAAQTNSGSGGGGGGGAPSSGMGGGGGAAGAYCEKLITSPSTSYSFVVGTGGGGGGPAGAGGAGGAGAAGIIIIDEFY